jgi:RND family efflux transporter MFP subunit
MIQRARSILFAASTAVIAVTAAVACKEKEAGEAEPKPVVAAQTIVVKPQAFTETFGAIGTVVGRAGHVATLSAPAAGRVAQALVATGQSVQAGQILIELDQAPFEASLQAAQAAFAAAQKSAERQQRLANEGIVPRKDAEAAASEMAKARADVVAAQRASQLSTLRAPIGGVVTRMAATLGASADPSQPLVEIADPSAVDVLLSVTPTDAGRVRPGEKVSLSAGQSASGEPLGIGTVADIAIAVDSVTRTVAIRVQVPGARRPLRIGETVFGSIAIGTKPNAIVLPKDALVPEGDGFKVFVVDANGIAHEREVKVGARSDAGVEILEGVAAGDRVVTYGAYGLSDSAKVEPLNSGAAPKAVPDSATKEKP